MLDKETERREAIGTLKDFHPDWFNVFLSVALQGCELFKRIAKFLWILFVARAGDAVDSDSIAIAFQRWKVCFSGFQFR